MPLNVSAPLRAAFAPQFRGRLLRMFAQSKSLEYLCGLCRYATGTPAQAPPVPALDVRLAELHAYLQQLGGHLPCLSTLAGQFGMSARRLNDTFADRYGQSIHAFVLDWRLNAAYLAVRESDVALKVLADRLGYAHVNHFNRAFRRKFGHPPGSRRRGRRCQDDEPRPDATGSGVTGEPGVTVVRTA
jgi:AraC-like DNA-binding protein